MQDKPYDEGNIPAVPSLLRQGWDWLAVEPHQRTGARALQVAAGLMLLFRVFSEGRFYNYLWGPDAIGQGGLVRLLGRDLGSLLDHAFATSAGTIGVLVVLAASAALLVSGRFTRLATLLALIMFLMLEQRLPELPDGGDNITRIVLVYMLFLLPPRAKPSRGELLVWFHNLAVLAIALQIVILYTTSGIMKAYGDKWHHGVAMYYVSQVEWFSLPAMRRMFMNPLVVTLSSYIPMFYQLFFAVAILGPLKLPWLFVGMLFHLGVASFMGLVSFSIAMVGLECFLISDAEYVRLAAIAHRQIAAANRRWNALRSRMGPAASPEPALALNPKTRIDRA